MLQRKYTTYDQALLKLNLFSLSERQTQLNLKWAKSGLKNGTLNDMFPLNIKKHKMNTRNMEKYEVQHHNTERMKRSSIVFMRQLLNEEEHKTQNKKRKRIEE